MIGFLGGTFDPVHLGHLHAARVAARVLGCDEMRLVLSARPPHRAAQVASVEQRWAMLTRAVATEPLLVADRREVERDTASYTVDTLEEVRNEYGPRRSLVWCIGWDQYLELLGWHRPDRLLELAHLAVLQRPGQQGEPRPDLAAFIASRLTDDAAAMRADPSGRVLLVRAKMLDVSASTIRRCIAHGESVVRLLPPSVWTYIRDNHLYRG